LRGSDRLSLVILVIAATGVLVLGTWWWVANAPVQPASATPTPAPTPVTSVWEQPDPIAPTVQRVRGGTVQVHVFDADPGLRYRLQYVCFGPGAMTLTVQGAEGGTQIHDVDCEGSFGEVELRPAQSQIQVAVERPDGEDGQVDLRLEVD
jgi:hypothetical protein